MVERMEIQDPFQFTLDFGRKLRRIESLYLPTNPEGKEEFKKLVEEFVKNYKPDFSSLVLKEFEPHWQSLYGKLFDMGTKSFVEALMLEVQFLINSYLRQGVSQSLKRD